MYVYCISGIFCFFVEKLYLTFDDICKASHGSSDNTIYLRKLSSTDIDIHFSNASNYQLVHIQIHKELGKQSSSCEEKLGFSGVSNEN